MNVRWFLGARHGSVTSGSTVAQATCAPAAIAVSQQAWSRKAGPLLRLSPTTMRTQLSTARISAFLEERRLTCPRNGTGAPEVMSPLAIRVHGEYREMPGLRLTVRQAARLFSLEPDLADAVLHELRCASILACSHDGAFVLVG